MLYLPEELHTSENMNYYGMIQFNFSCSLIWRLDIVQKEKFIKQATKMFNVLNYQCQKKA